MKQKAGVSSQTVSILFPRIYRFITEYSFTDRQVKEIKVLAVSIVSVFLLLLIFLEGVVMWHQLRQQQYLSMQREKVIQQIAYWQGIANTYKGYRDVYYRLASLQYKLGNTDKAQVYIKKAMELDPNFPEGSVLGAKIGLK